MTRGYICNACEQFYTGKAGADLKFYLVDVDGVPFQREAELCPLCARVDAERLGLIEGDNDDATN